MFGITDKIQDLIETKGVLLMVLIFKKITANEMAKIIKDYPVGQILNFCLYYDEYENDGVGWYAIQKMNWLDSDIMLIGGYENISKCLDLRIYEEFETENYIENFIKDYFENEIFLDSVYIKIEENNQ